MLSDARYDLVAEGSTWGCDREHGGEQPARAHDRPVAASVIASPAHLESTARRATP